MPTYNVTFYYRFKVNANSEEEAVEHAIERLPDEEPIVDVREVS